MLTLLPTLVFYFSGVMAPRPSSSCDVAVAPSRSTRSVLPCTGAVGCGGAAPERSEGSSGAAPLGSRGWALRLPSLLASGGGGDVPHLPSRSQGRVGAAALACGAGAVLEGLRTRPGDDGPPLEAARHAKRTLSPPSREEDATDDDDQGALGVEVREGGGDGARKGREGGGGGAPPSKVQRYFAPGGGREVGEAFRARVEEPGLRGTHVGTECARRAWGTYVEFMDALYPGRFPRGELHHPARWDFLSSSPAPTSSDWALFLHFSRVSHGSSASSTVDMGRVCQFGRELAVRAAALRGLAVPAAAFDPR